MGYEVRKLHDELALEPPSDVKRERRTENGLRCNSGSIKPLPFPRILGTPDK